MKLNKAFYIQFTAGKGPTECAVACEKVFVAWRNQYIDDIHFVATSWEADYVAGLRSVTVMIPDADINDPFFAKMRKEWEGTVKYIATKNSIRQNHKRKNWYVGVNFFEGADEINMQDDGKDLKWETMRASGPGGQHVNRTESAVRVTHIPTGITVHCEAQRNQTRNKEIALQLLMAKIKAFNNTKLDVQKSLIWMNHNTLERGNEVKTIKGEL